MKILHIITGLNVGGAETMLARLMENQALTPDIDCEIVTLMAPGMVGGRIAETGTPIHSLRMRGRFPSPLAAIQLTRLARSCRPDLIMGWMHHGHIAASWAGAMAPERPPVIWNVRHSLSGYRDEKLRTRILLRLGAWTSGKPVAIIYNSRAACRQYRAFGYRAKAEIVIPNGFDRRTCRPREEARRAIHALFGVRENGVLIGMVARNHPMKDTANLVAAFARLVRRHPDIHLLIVGEGMDRPVGTVAELLSSLPPGSWTLAGHRTDVPEWLAGLDILALPSAWGEGFPNIVGEAMACGVPCVGTDVGDTYWVIGSTGRTVPPRDTGALTAALSEMVAWGRDGRAALGRAAMARIEARFALPTIVHRYADVLREHGRPATPHVRVATAMPAGDAP